VGVFSCYLKGGREGGRKRPKKNLRIERERKTEKEEGREGGMEGGREGAYLYRQLCNFLFTYQHGQHARKSSDTKKDQPLPPPHPHAGPPSSWPGIERVQTKEGEEDREGEDSVLDSEKSEIDL